MSAVKTQELRHGDNPARWKGHLDQVLAKPQKLSRGHHRALAYARVPGLLKQLRAREGVAARCLEFLILSGTRSSEARVAKWSEFDFDQNVWTVPKTRMKAGKEFRVPLTARMLEILEELRKNSMSMYAFPGPGGSKPLSERGGKPLLERMKVDCVPHGFRSSFRDWAAEQTDYPHEIVEAALAHITHDATVAASRRTSFFDKRRALMEAWEAHCEMPSPLPEAQSATRSV